jgi:hypothetical protein
LALFVSELRPNDLIASLESLLPLKQSMRFGKLSLTRTNRLQYLFEAYLSDNFDTINPGNSNRYPTITIFEVDIFLNLGTTM